MDNISIFGWASALQELRSRAYRYEPFDVPLGPIVLGRRRPPGTGPKKAVKKRKFKGSKAAKRQHRCKARLNPPSESQSNA